jgi:hypothetical protein
MLGVAKTHQQTKCQARTICNGNVVDLFNVQIRVFQAGFDDGFYVLSVEI